MSTQLRGYRYRLCPTPEQRHHLSRWAGCCRWVYNAALALRESARKTGGEVPGYAAMCRQLTGWKQNHPWLREPSAVVLQQALKDLEQAVQRICSGLS